MNTTTNNTNDVTHALQNNQHVIWLHDLTINDLAKVGGKNASLGEMINHLHKQNIRVPDGFATTTYSYYQFLNTNGLKERIDTILSTLNVNNVVDLAKTGRQIQAWIYETPLPIELEQAIEVAYAAMVQKYGDSLSVAVRSSATSEDLPNASFAGQQDTFLNISGVANVKQAVHRVFASLYNDRAIAYRAHKGFSHDAIHLSVGVQKMVRCDLGSAGVMFTIDTESGFDKVVFINASYGLGECIVQGMVNPDEFYVYKNNLGSDKLAIIRKNLGNKLIKMVFAGTVGDSNYTNSVNTINVEDDQRRQFALSDTQIIELATTACAIEKHYGKAMDIEWAYDGLDKQLYILQARPETVKSQEQANTMQRYVIKDIPNQAVLVSGRAVGQKATYGTVKIIINREQMHSIKAGDVLVTDMTDPDWEPVMKIASAIITNRGGRTCHAAIIARELGVPAIVGCNNATSLLKDGELVTVSCCQGDTGYVYRGKLPIEVISLSQNKMPKIPVDIMMNVGTPDLAFSFSAIPNRGVGLARLEFIINRQIGIHPKALLEFDSLPQQIKRSVVEKISGYSSPINFYVDKLAEGIASIAAAFSPKKVITRLSDFKTNEYSNLIGGKLYEPIEENPMMGFRGASRYIAPAFRDCFELECMAINKVRNTMGFTNVAIMVPFVRTLQEAKAVIELLEQNGLKRGVNDLEIYMMCEIPANALLAHEFLEYFDGFSIGSNDMTQLTLGIDRDANGAISASFDERNEAVKTILAMAIKACKDRGKYVGICGQGPSDHPDFARWLISQNIDTISLNPDTVIDTWLYLANNMSAQE